MTIRQLSSIKNASETKFDFDILSIIKKIIYLIIKIIIYWIILIWHFEKDCTNMFFCRIWLYDVSHVICHMVHHMMCRMTGVTCCVKWANRRTGGTCSIRLNSHSSCQVLNTLFYIHSITIKHRAKISTDQPFSTQILV